MRIRSTLAGLALGAAAAVMPAPASAQYAEQVHFAPGASSTVINGVVRGRDFVDYVVNVRRGERLSVSMSSNHRRVYFNLIGPGGNVYYSGMSSNPPNRFEGAMRSRGMQRIRVYLYRSSERRNEVANFQLYISTSGRQGWDNRPVPLPGPGYPNPGYPGAGFRPFGMIQCITPGANSDRCQASVQHLGPGLTYVQVRLPNGIVRTITYQNGTATSIDSGPPGGSFLANRRGSDTIVQVGNEHYVIPDAILYAR